MKCALLATRRRPHGPTATCEEPPGVREGATGKLYLAYLRDLDGNKLCGLYRVPRE